MTTITVTPHDIASGQRKSCSLCPLARAIDRVLRPSVRSNVGITAVFLTSKDGLCGNPLGVALPEAAVAFRESFDEGRPVEPFTFEMDIPEAFLS